MFLPFKVRDYKIPVDGTIPILLIFFVDYGKSYSCLMKVKSRGGVEK